VRNLILFLIPLLGASTAFGQDLSCSGNECSSSYWIGNKEYTTTCTSGAGTLSCHTSDPDSSYDPGLAFEHLWPRG
jgi:hypothetical protein